MFRATDPKPNLRFYTTIVNKPSQQPVLMDINMANLNNDLSKPSLVVKKITPKLSPAHSRAGSRTGSRLSKPAIRKPITIKKSSKG